MNPINYLFALAILAPLVLIPLYFILRRWNQLLGAIVGTFAFNFTIVDILIVMNGQPFGPMINSLYHEPVGLFWLFCFIPGILIALRIFEPEKKDLESLWTPPLFFLITLMTFMVGLIAYFIGSNLWIAIQEALHLVPLG